MSTLPHMNSNTRVNTRTTKYTHNIQTQNANNSNTTTQQLTTSTPTPSTTRTPTTTYTYNHIFDTYYNDTHTIDKYKITNNNMYDNDHDMVHIHNDSINNINMNTKKYINSDNTSPTTLMVTPATPTTMQTQQWHELRHCKYKRQQ